MPKSIRKYPFSSARKMSRGLWGSGTLSLVYLANVGEHLLKRGAEATWLTVTSAVHSIPYISIRCKDDPAKTQRENSLPALYFTPPFPYPAEEPRSLSIRIFLIRSSRLGMSGWSSKRRENQSRLPLWKICSRWTSPTASSIPSPRPQAYSSAAYSFLLLPNCVKNQRGICRNIFRK